MRELHLAPRDTAIGRRLDEVSYDDAKPRAALVAPSFPIGIGDMANDASLGIVQLAPAHRVQAAEPPMDI